MMMRLTRSSLRSLWIVSALTASATGAAAFVPRTNAAGSTSPYDAASFIPPAPTPSTPSASASTTSQLSMATSGQMACRPIGIGSAAPETIVTNTDLEAVVETNDEWIKTRTGISSRRVLLHEQKIHELAVQAGANALEMAGVDAEDIDVVICATSTPDDMFGDAPRIASELGCTKKTVAFDITAACSGFLFSTVTAGKFLSGNGNTNQKALVIGADALSRWVDWDDRNSCILFGDGAGAMVLESCDSADASASGVLGYSAHSNGLGAPDLNLSYEGSDRKVSTPGGGTNLSNGSYGKLAMNGQEVFKFATREVPKVLKEALEAAELNVEDVDWLLLHQANIRIMEGVAKRLGIPMDKVITNLSEHGNTSAASIPLALDAAVRSGKVKKGDIIACAGFGAGLSWGSAILKWGGQ